MSRELCLQVSKCSQDGPAYMYCTPTERYGLVQKVFTPMIFFSFVMISNIYLDGRICTLP
jgi:hypothetical protein